MDPRRTRWFGVAWNPTVCDPEYQVPVPTSQTCGHCSEGFAADDNGVVLNAGTVAFHYECFMRLIVGPLAHVAGTCACFGGDPLAEVEPEGMTLRQAAAAAVSLWEKQRRRDVG